MNISNGPAILYPMFALAALTASVLGLVPITRVRAGQRGELQVDDFKYGESAAVPPRVSIPNRNYMNLLEFPLLAYVACLTAYVASDVTALMVQTAWAYVVMRMVHSAIHLTYNRVAHRALVFGTSNFVLVALWVQVGMHLR